ncbi:MAG: hypothetical protein D6698_16255 [Gammaproteobacteria bacterium]|nr:MAG: hypothetical protein D6698_16255 [Gammaproteobacteria bacterium]
MSYKFKDHVEIAGLHRLGQITTANRTALTPSREGAIVYDMNQKAVFAYDGTGWFDLTASGTALPIVSSDTFNSLRSGSDSLPYLINAPVYRYFKSSVSITNGGNPGEPYIYHHPTTGNTGTVTVEGSSRVSGGLLSLSDISFVFNRSPSEYLTITGGSSLVMTYGGNPSMPPRTMEFIWYDSNYNGLQARGYLIHDTPDVEGLVSRLGVHYSKAPTVPPMGVIALNTLHNPSTTFYYHTSIEGVSSDNVRLLTDETIRLYPGVYKLIASLKWLAPISNSDVLRFQWQVTDGNGTRLVGVEGYTGDDANPVYQRFLYHQLPAIAYVKISGAVGSAALISLSNFSIDTTQLDQLASVIEVHRIR